MTEVLLRIFYYYPFDIWWSVVIFSISFLVLVICILFFLCQLSILLMFFKKQFFVLIDFLCFFSYFVDFFFFYTYYFLIFVCFGFVLIFFPPGVLRGELRLLIWHSFFFFCAINFPLIADLVMFHKF